LGIARQGKAEACQPNVDSDRHPRIVAPKNCEVFQKARSQFFRTAALGSSEHVPRCFVVSRSAVPSPRRASAGEKGVSGQKEAPNTPTLVTAYDIARRQAIPAGNI
jgi:hypothetical protein